MRVVIQGSVRGHPRVTGWMENWAGKNPDTTFVLLSGTGVTYKQALAACVLHDWKYEVDPQGVIDPKTHVAMVFPRVNDDKLRFMLEQAGELKVYVAPAWDGTTLVSPSAT